MHWIYRIIKHDKSKPVYFAVHEVYYDDKGRIENWTADPINAIGDNKQEVLKTLKHMIEDTKQPVCPELSRRVKLKVDISIGKNWGEL